MNLTIGVLAPIFERLVKILEHLGKDELGVSISGRFPAGTDNINEGGAEKLFVFKSKWGIVDRGRIRVVKQNWTMV